MRRLVAVVALAGSLLAGEVWAVNSVVVESKSVGTGQSNARIHVRLTNDANVVGLAVPLIIRELTPGSFITSLKLGYEDRLAGPSAALSDLRVNRIFPDLGGSCGPVAFTTSSSNDTLPHPVLASPEGVMVAGVAIVPSNHLAAGADVSGSIVLSIGATSTPGQFEIDTACVNPANHLLYAIEEPAQNVVPDFTKGTISIVPNLPPIAQCHDVTVNSGPNCDAMASVDNGSYDPEAELLIFSQTPPGPYPLGQTAVTMIVQDPVGFADTCQAMVTVVRGSANPPVARCHDVAAGYAMGGQAFASIDNGSYDPDGDPITLTQIPHGPYPLGQTLVKLIVSDGTCGLDSCEATVTVAPGMCNGAPVDVNCDGVIDVFDVLDAVDAIFNNNGAGLGPCCVNQP